MRCPDCKKLIAPHFPLHDCTPKEKTMTRTNMKLSEICKFWRAEKPLYLEIEKDGKPRRVRIVGLYVKAGYQLQVKLASNKAEWLRVEPAQIICAY